MKITAYIPLVLSFLCRTIISLILTKHDLNYKYIRNMIIFISAIVIPSVVHYENNKKKWSIYYDTRPNSNDNIHIIIENLSAKNVRLSLWFNGAKLYDDKGTQIKNLNFHNYIFSDMTKPYILDKSYWMIRIPININQIIKNDFEYLIKSG